MQTQSPNRLRREKVILVDDDENVLLSYSRHLKKNFDVKTADTGHAALQMIEREGPFSVILSDLRMPEMDGIELLTRLRNISPETVRIVLTGYADLESAYQAMNLCHVFRFLIKPCSLNDLENAVHAGIEQNRLTRSEKEFHAIRKLKNSLESVISGFSRLIEMRSLPLSIHHQRVTQLAMTIAHSMDLYVERITILGLAAMVHDLGKVCLPMEIFYKGKDLNPAEKAIYQTHPEIAAQILHPVDFHWPIGMIVNQHHERMDGSGFPSGLKGRDICKEAKVIAVADFVENLVSENPHNGNVGVARAMKELEKGRGRLFDPEIVDICLQLFEKETFKFN